MDLLKVCLYEEVVSSGDRDFKPSDDSQDHHLNVPSEARKHSVVRDTRGHSSIW